MRVTCVVGLPGSGKSHWAYGQPCSWVCDDPKSLSDLPSLQYLTILGWNLIITDPWFCDAQVRQKAADHIHHTYGVSPEWIFFENDPVQCELNVLHRQDGRKVRGMILLMHKVYQIPPDVTPWCVYQCQPNMTKK